MPSRPLATYRDGTIEWACGGDEESERAPRALRHVLSSAWPVLVESSLVPFMWRVADLVGAVGVERIVSSAGDVFHLAPLAFPGS